LLLLLADIGIDDDARRLLYELAADDFRAVPRDLLFVGAMCMIAEAAFRLREVDLADAIDAELRPWADLGSGLGHINGFVGAVSRFLALLAWLRGRGDEADRLFAHAVDFNRGIEFVPYLARSLADWAGLCLERGDYDRARALAGEAREIAGRHGLVAVVNQVQAYDL
jgi:hypothetical protein